MVDYTSEVVDKSQIPIRSESQGLKYMRMLEAVEDGKVLHLTFPIAEKKAAMNVISFIRVTIKQYNRPYIVHQRSVTSDSSVDLYIWREYKET